MILVLCPNGRSRASTVTVGRCVGSTLRSNPSRVSPRMVIQAFSNIHQARHALATKIIDDTKALITGRPAGPRNQGADDAIFGPANHGIILAVSHRDLAMSRQIFAECYDFALAYEAAKNCQMHKGSITFNVGIAY